MALIEEILEDAGFDTAQATRAEDGIERLHQGGVDMVLMDISLPNMDGLEATRIIKADKALKVIPIIGLSAHAMQSDQTAALEAGCDAYQTKPINEDVLLTTIHRLLK
jgi:CheY-like chemotaxis protein